MKKLLLMILGFIIWMLLLALAISCEEDQFESEQGCQTGVLNGSRTLIRCSTLDQHRAGNNQDKGGLSTATWDLYSSIKWERCDDCK